MGNLPFSRTVTLNPSDPVPSALLNELQDQVVGFKHSDLIFQRQFSDTFQGSGPFPHTTPGITNTSTSISFEAALDPVIVGSNIVQLDFDIVVVSGNGVYRAELYESIRAPGGSPANATNQFTGQSSTTTPSNQRVSVLLASINGGSGLVVSRNGMYYGFLNCVSGTTTSILIEKVSWTMRRP